MIQILSENTINKIAAGEVIENPASLIKELVENSLDARAEKISVEILGGGLLMIKVADDGCGMNREDAILSLERHATSKIREAEDLFSVETMGFRGEALASIAAISQMTLSTAGEDGVGTRIKMDGGELKDISVCARSRGTTIEVRNVFYNVPARKQFQKSQSVCTAQVTRTLVTLSLAHPEVTFMLSEGERQILCLVKGEEQFPMALKRRVADTLGEEFLKDAAWVEAEMPLFSLKGIVGSVHNTRPNRQLQYQFVNGRAVTCPTVSYAVRQAFGTRIAEGRFPVYVLHLEIAKEYVDVNVHPQKKEIRLREERWVEEKIIEAVQKNFVVAKPTVYPNFFIKPAQERVVEEKVAIEAVPIVVPQMPIRQRPVVLGLYRHFLWVDASSVPGMGEGTLLVDLKAAGAAVLYDALAVRQEQREQQQLSVPLTFAASTAEIEHLCACEQELGKLGFALRRARNAVLIEAIPASLDSEEVVEFLQGYLCEEKKLEGASAKIATARCGKHTPFSAVALFEALLRAKDPYTCPMGRRTIIHLGENELQKLFKGR